MTQGSDGRRDWFETACDASYEDATDGEVLAALVAEMRADFGCDGVARFALAYGGTAITFLPSLAREPTSKPCQCIAIEAHDADTHLRAHREIIRQPGREPVRGA